MTRFLTPCQISRDSASDGQFATYSEHCLRYQPDNLTFAWQRDDMVTRGAARR